MCKLDGLCTHHTGSDMKCTRESRARRRTSWNKRPFFGDVLMLSVSNFLITRETSALGYRFPTETPERETGEGTALLEELVTLDFFGQFFTK